MSCSFLLCKRLIGVNKTSILSSLSSSGSFQHQSYRSWVEFRDILRLVCFLYTVKNYTQKQDFPFASAACFSIRQTGCGLGESPHFNNRPLTKCLGSTKRERASVFTPNYQRHLCVCVRILGFRKMFFKVTHSPSLFLLDKESCLQDNSTFSIQARICITLCLVIPGRKWIPSGTKHILFSYSVWSVWSKLRELKEWEDKNPAER